jgi:Tfp pilus assembly protein PilN
MINLLPPEYKDQLIYARRNTRMVRWSFVMGFVVVGMVLIIGAGMLFIHKSIDSYTASNADTEAQLKLQKVDEIQKEVKTFSDNMKLVVQVLSKEVLFSKLIKQMGSAMPPNTVLDGLQINQIQGGLDFSARAKDYDAATQVQVNLKDPKNKIFSDTDLLSITCQDTAALRIAASKGTNVSQIDLNYPCTVHLRGLFSKDNPFLFANNSKATK